MTVWLWAAFLTYVVAMLALDLGVFHKKAHAVAPREALGWTTAWVTQALLFGVLVYFMYEHHWLGMGAAPGLDVGGATAALEYVTGYLIELSLSFDNIFVMALIFQYFRVPLEYQHRVLFWGILGAQIMRGIMIGAGVVLIRRFDWMVYVFGGLLLFTAVRMLVSQQESIDPNRSIAVRLAKRLYPVTPHFDGPRFFTEHEGRRSATPLLLVLVLVESMDVVFAVDSIPAIFAVTQDPFLIFTSNIFAILGLRSMYFLLAALIARFRYLKLALVFLLAFVGVKLMVSHHWPIPTLLSLGIILGILAVGVVLSLVIPVRSAKDVAEPGEPPRAA
ncbi:MAG: TerC family protein [Deltaproteobacteria bacterium]|nr:TerC family protein [Deltaproteobacteria bacterium]